MEFTTSRNKNYINFLAEGKNKPYTFDINTGIFYSLQSKPLKNLPPKFKTFLDKTYKNDAILTLMYNIINYPYNFSGGWHFSLSMFSDYVDLFKVVDKLNSLGYKFNKNLYEFRYNTLTIINNHFKAFVKSYNEDKNITINNFINHIYPLLWAKEKGIEQNEVITIDFIRNLLSMNYADDELTYFINCLKKGVFYYFTYNDYEISIDTHALFNKFKKYFTMCKELNIPFDKDFFRGYINAEKMYITYKKKIDSETIINNYKKHNFIFEDDNFIVVVPQSTEDFKKEAIEQQNCVYSTYLSKVVKGETNVVFVRKKDNIDKSYITCEITNKGNINQFLLRFNHSIEKNSIEMEFLNSYKNWLKENWE